MNFEQQLQAAQQRLRAIQNRAKELPEPLKALQEEAISEFSIALEELHVATEELQVQNEELLTSRNSLELERQRYQELFDFAPDGYLVTDEKGVIQEANNAATQMLNLAKERLEGKPMIVFVDKVDQTSFHTQLEHLIQRRESLIDWEVKLKPRELSAYSVSISVSSMYYDPQGQLMGFRWLLRDLRQRKQNEEQIREQADLLNVSTDAIIVCGMENQIQFWNNGAERLYRWRASEVLGKNINEWLHREWSSRREAGQNEQILLTGEWRGELEQVTCTDEDIIVESHWTLVRDEAGEPKSIFIVNTDITEKKQMETQLLQCQRVESLGTLARGIAHDLNNTMTPILGVAQLLPRTIQTMDERSLRLLNILESSAKRAIELIRQIQMYTGRVEGNKIVFDIGTIILDIEKLTEQIFPKSIVVNTEIVPDLWCVEGDSTQLHQVVMNLCINARDAMTDGGTLGLSIKNQVIDETNIGSYPEAHLGPYIVITVLDTGIGIPAENASRIFDPFFTTKEESQRSGLGLSIVTGIVKNHDGFVVVSSRVGKGSCFKVYLPALQGIAAAVTETLNCPRGNSELILLVDDETTILETNKLLFEDFGYQVLTAQNGAEAQSLYRQHQDQISLVLMDMMMPSMDGATTSHGLKAINDEVKIIANSGLALNDQSSSDISTVINAFLPKPCSLERLLTTIQEVIHSD